MRLSIPAVLLSLPLIAKLDAQTIPLPYDADLYHKHIEVVSTHAEFLYWTVQEPSIDYAQTMHQAAPATSYAIGHVESATYQCDPGVRVGVSYYNAPKYWELKGQYTHLTNKGKNRAGKPNTADHYLTGTWPQIIDGSLVHAHSSIELNYNVFDALIARMFYPNPHLRMRVLAGLATTWIRQDWKFHYFNAANANTLVHNRWHYVGAGIRIGISADWFWGSNVYLTGATTTGLFMGRYTNLAKQTASTESLAVRNSYFHDNRPAYTAQFILGPARQKNYGQHRLELFAGYELTAWMNLQEVHRSTSGAASVAKETWINSGMFAIHGLTTRFTCDF